MVLQSITKNAPYAWENFHACAIARFQKPQHLGRARIACSSILTCAESRAQSQRPALLQPATETTASGSTGKENLKADRRVRHYKEVGLQKWPLADRATVPRVLCGIGLCMSLRRRTNLSKSLRAPAPVELTIHTFRTVDITAGRRFAVVAPVREEVIMRNLVTIARFIKPLFANMHHRVHAVAGALRKPNVARPHPDVSTGWPA